MKPDIQTIDNWEKFAEALPQAILVLDTSGKILYANQVACILFNKSIIGSNFSYPIETQKPSEIEIPSANNKLIYAEINMREASWKNNPVWIVSIYNITQRKETENKLNILANVFRYAKEGVMITDANLNILDVNTEFTNITQYTKEEVIGKKPSILKSGIQNAIFYKKMWDHIHSEGYWHGEIYNKKKNNETYPQLLEIFSIKNTEGNLINYVGIFYDITLQESQKKQLMHVAYFDSLTNLPNRQSLMSRLEIAMKNAERHHQFIALAFIDIDDFKSINDLHSHEVGDKLLIKVAALIKSETRETDTLARLSGDEFVLLMEGLKKPTDYKYIMEKVHAIFEQPLNVNSHSFLITISSGISFYPQKVVISPAAFLSQADQAMYKSKMSGKNQYSLFDISLDLEIRNQEKLLKEIRSAVKNNQLKLFYQPKVNMKTGELIGLEGLIRWEHPKLGLLEPSDFLPKIENDAFLFELSELTMKQALKQIQSWNEMNDHLTISINMNALQIEQENFFEKLNFLVQTYPENIAQRLEIEILESSEIEKFKLTKEIIKKCNEIGIQFSLDDFGTRYSSISYLTNLSFKYLKVDVEFIRNIIDNERNTKILQAILDIASAMNIQVIAEGVETQAHIDYLVKLGCVLGQGNAISKPMPPEAFPSWHQAWNNRKNKNMG